MNDYNTIPSCKDLRKLKLKVARNIKNEKRACEIKDKYMETLERIIKKDSEYQTSYIDNIKLFKRERYELENNTYYNYTDGNTFEDTILHIIEWFKDHQSRITFNTIDKIINNLPFEKHSRYLICNIIDNPFDLIQIKHSPINFNQAYRIVKELDIPVTDKLLVQKWAIFALQDNNGSFYKIKSKKDSKNKYEEYSGRPFKSSWYNLLREFCEKNGILAKYYPYCNILNDLLIQHKTIKHLYGIREFIEIEKEIGDDVLELFHGDDETIDDVKFDKFIRYYETNECIKLTDEQIDAIKHTITDKLCIITGYPGTGKSTIIKATIEWFNLRAKENRREYNISLMAPTGKALKGLLNKCDNITYGKICGTLHKCLLNTFPKIAKEIDKKSRSNYYDDDDDYEYPHYIHKIIVDEASMVDIFMFKKLIEECEYFQCSLVLCGDVKQLPPIGKGRPFECIINSGLFDPIRLTDIKRQDTGKLKDCILKINKNKLSIADFDNNSTIFIDHDFNNYDETVQICKHIVEKYGENNIAFISPEHKYPCGVYEMNRLLQSSVYNTNNMNSKSHGDFNDGDYVLRTENQYDGDVIRVNGDTGRMYFGESSKTVTILYDDFDSQEEEKEEVPIDKIRDLFMLNYSNTVHKLQGSQKEVVVFICDPRHSTISWRTTRLKLAYTAISRAKQTLIILGDKDTFFNVQKCKDEPFVSSFMTEFIEYDIE